MSGGETLCVIAVVVFSLILSKGIKWAREEILDEIQALRELLKEKKQ
jgi:hypothetical protein